MFSAVTVSAKPGTDEKDILFYYDGHGHRVVIEDVEVTVQPSIFRFVAAIYGCARLCALDEFFTLKPDTRNLEP